MPRDRERSFARRDRREAATRKHAAQKGRGRTVLETIFARVGLRQGMKVGTFIAAWAIVENELGPDISVEQYAEWWKENLSTAFREQRLFRECFPEFMTPHELIEACKVAKVEPSIIGLRQVAWQW